MAPTTRSVTTPVRPTPDHPANGKLRPLTAFMAKYAAQGLPDGTHVPAAVALLHRLGIGSFHMLSYLHSTLGYALDDFLEKMRERAATHHLACGGKRCTLADLEQASADLGKLAKLSDVALCERIFEEALLLTRLLHTGQLAFARWDRLRRAGQAETKRGQRLKARWQDWHLAAGAVLLRLVQTCARLVERVDRWYAEQCLRHELERLWGELFGPNVPIGQEWRWLHQLKLPPAVQRRILRYLVIEPNDQRRISLMLKGQDLPRETPPAFFKLVAAWQRGKSYQSVRA